MDNMGRGSGRWGELEVSGSMDENMVAVMRIPSVAVAILRICIHLAVD
jgi:hypothetical protein